MDSHLYLKNIPQELKECHQWVMWKKVTKEGQEKPTKIPYTIKNTEAKVNNPGTWDTFQNCVNALMDGHDFAGIGFVFDDHHDYIGVDYDGVRDPETRKIDSEIEEEILGLCSYTEISQSGKGLHVICKGKKPGERCRSGFREMYDKDRFFVMTGNHLEGTPEEVNTAPVEAIKVVYDKIDKPKENNNKISQRVMIGSSSMEDEEIISLLMRSSIAEKIKSLFNNSIDGYPSNSEADQALANYIAFYTQDGEQIERLMRMSELARSKWDTHPTYLKNTICKAIEDLTDKYTPPRSNEDNNKHFDKTLSREQIIAKGMQASDIRLEISLPENHLLKKIVNWMSGLTDAYHDYIICAGLWLLSACTEGKAILELRQGTIRPNLWYYILGLSSVSRKSTVVEKIKIIYENCTQTKLYNDEYSVEGYLELLQDNNNSHFIRDECVGLLHKMHKKHNEGIFEHECQIYDGQSIRKKLAKKQGKKDEVIIDNPYVTKFYATTPDNFYAAMTIEDMLTGYGPRFLYCHPKYSRERKPLELLRPDDKEAFSDVLFSVIFLYDHFKRVDKMLFNIDKEAFEYYNNVITEMESYILNTADNTLSMAWARNQVHILKIAMLLEIGKEKPSNSIGMDTMKLAVQMVKDYFLPMFLETMERIQQAEKFNKIEKVKGVLLKNNGISDRSSLLKYSRLMKKDFDEVIMTMLESGEIESFNEEGSNKKWYVLIKDVSPFSQISRNSQAHINNKNVCENCEIDNSKDESARCAGNSGHVTCETVKSVNQETLPDIIQFCGDWQQVFDRSITQSDVIPVAMDYCKRKKYPDVEGVVNVVRKFAKIPPDHHAQAGVACP